MFNFASVVNLEHVSDCKSCDHNVLLYVDLYAKIWLFTSIVNMAKCTLC